ncbi:MAG: transcriptional regulator [Gaiellaceae bacterium]|jgi:DNA-binding transcriptional ArsR family regulator|nr:transcriptional regulator [Gaiellaceae bacterium]
MPRVNELGDLEITDPRAMRALAQPVRLTIFERLQRHGPAPVAELAADAGTTRSAAGRHLRQLAQHGFVVESDGKWKAVGTGIHFEPADDDASQAAYRALANQLFLRAHELPSRWMTEDEPRLDGDWRRVSGLSNARMTMTVEEAAQLDAQMEKLLEPYVTRDASDAPGGARRVRWLRYLMPEAD